MIGESLGKYRILETLGKGGMGIVYRAEDTLLRREVALKVLPDSRAASDEASERFLREARAAARLLHPNLVAIHDAGHERGIDFIVLELIHGRSAQEILDDRGPFPSKRGRWSLRAGEGTGPPGARRASPPCS